MPTCRRHPVLAALAAVAVILGTVGITAGPAPAVTADSLATAVPNGFSGGGFVNVVAVNPLDSGVLLAGGDVSGLFRSVDGGTSWAPANTGLWNLNQFHVAEVEFSRQVPGRAYAAVGYRGLPGGGLIASDDAGVTWYLVSDAVQFSGANNGAGTPLPSTHPRSTGDLIVVDEAARTITAATFDQGVMRSTDAGATWRSIGLGGSYLRAAVADPVHTSDVLVAAYGTGVFRVDVSGGVSAIAGSPSGTEELAVVGTEVFAAAGTDGVFRSGDGGNTWRHVLEGSSSGPEWISISGGVDVNGREVVYAGCTTPAQTGDGMFASVVGSTDAGESWTSLTSDSAVTDAGDWWLAETQPWMMLGRGAYVAAQIVTVQGDPSRVYVAGRSGVWRSRDGGAHWKAAVDGLGVTINRDVVVDPTTPGRVYVANTDWVLLGSSDGLDSVRQIRPPSSNTGYGLGLDATTTPASLVIATGDRDTNSAGEVFTSADPFVGPWVNEGLADSTGSKIPVAVAMNHVGGERIVLAAVDGDGLWRKAGDTWSRVSDAASTAIASNSAAFSWAPGSTTVFLYEPDSGLWRSDDAGGRWTLLRQVTSDIPMTGHLVADPTTSDVLYLSVSSGVFRVDGANGASPTFTDLHVDRPGPITVDANGTLFASSRAARGVPAGLVRSDDSGRTWAPAADASYAAGGGAAFALASGSGRLFAAMNGDGVVTLTGQSATPPPTTQPPPTTGPPSDPGTPTTDSDGDGFSDAWDPLPGSAFSGSLTVWGGTAQAGDVGVSLVSLDYFGFALRSVQVNTPGRVCLLILDPHSAWASAPNAATIETPALCLSGVEFGPTNFRLTIIDGGVAGDVVHIRIGNDPEITLGITAGDLHVAGSQ